MILYLDTSALVKKYFQKSFSQEVTTYWRQATEIAISSVAFAEAIAAIYRKKRESSLKSTVTKRIVDSLSADWQSFIRIHVTDDLNDHILKAIKAHPLRGFDAIHLASALVMFEKFGNDLLFLCFDQKLAEAARSEGIPTFPNPVDSPQMST